MVDFGGWDMPVNYGSQIEEHHAVRRDAGMFDVSHMCIADVSGARVRDYLRYLLANDVAKLKDPGKALYSCMLNEHGGVVDDLIVYFLTEHWFRMVVNAGTRDKDIAWLSARAPRPTASTVQPRAGPGDDRRARPERAREGGAGDPAEHRSAALALGTFFGAESCRAVRRTDRLHRRRRLGSHAARARARRFDVGGAARRRVSGNADSARATRCGSKRA